MTMICASIESELAEAKLSVPMAMLNPLDSKSMSGGSLLSMVRFDSGQATRVKS
jgi:hypothetical protein